MMFRVGTRTCNSQLIFNGKTKINELFYAGKHPIYQNIMFQTYYDEINMPPELRKDMDAYASASRTGHNGKCQSGDAMLVEVNKESKSWLKLSGAPSEEQWLRVFRNLDKLNEVSFHFLLLSFLI